MQAKVLCNEGDTLIAESPSFIGSLNAFRSFNVNLIGIEQEEGGMKLDELERVMKNAPGQKVIYVIPNFQNPTGSTMSFEKRKGIYELACKYNGVIIEDNPYGDLRFAGESVPSIKSLDKEGRVIYVGSFSKISGSWTSRRICMRSTGNIPEDGCLQAGVRRSHKHLAAACML